MSEQPQYDGMRQGGLMRCCTDTIHDLYPNGPAKVATEGQSLQCKYAPDSPNHRMRFSNGAWEWDQNATTPYRE